MAYTLQQSIYWSSAFIQGSPLTAWTTNEPALSMGSMIRTMMTSAPFVWGWNRAESSATSTVAGTQDYTLSLTDFGFLEKVSLSDTAGNVWEIKDIYNTSALAKASTLAANRQRPSAVSVKAVTYGTSVSLRFSGVPDAVYVINATYQMLALPFTTLSGNWSPIPDSFIDIYNNLFLGEALQTVDDARSTLYRQRGVAGLLSKAEGLTEMQKNAFLAQYLARDSQTLLTTLRAQQSQNARGV